MGRSLRRIVPLLFAAALPVWSQDSVGFNAQVVPILNQHCVMCHLPGAAQAGLNLYPDPWAALVGVASTQSPLKLVEPGSAEKSYLYRKLLGTQQQAGGTGLRMPFQQDPLDAGDLETMRTWIEQGAASN
jgi:mono/diheme cytochrome c family protein